MPWKLKANAPEFDCVDGPFAGKKYRRGEVYAEVPPGDKGRFETVKKSAPAKAAKPPAKKNATSDEPVGAKDLSPRKGGSKT